MILFGQRADVGKERFVDLIERPVDGDLAPPAQPGCPIPPIVTSSRTLYAVRPTNTTVYSFRGAPSTGEVDESASRSFRSRLCPRPSSHHLSLGFRRIWSNRHRIDRKFQQLHRHGAPFVPHVRLPGKL